MFIRRYEEHRNVALVDWGRTDEALFEAMTAPSRDGWQGIVLVNGSTIDYDGSRWRQGTPV